MMGAHEPTALMCGACESPLVATQLRCPECGTTLAEYSDWKSRHTPEWHLLSARMARLLRLLLLLILQWVMVSLALAFLATWGVPPRAISWIEVGMRVYLVLTLASAMTLAVAMDVAVRDLPRWQVSLAPRTLDRWIPGAAAALLGIILPSIFSSDNLPWAVPLVDAARIALGAIAVWTAQDARVAARRMLLRAAPTAGDNHGGSRARSVWAVWGAFMFVVACAPVLRHWTGGAGGDLRSTMASLGSASVWSALILWLRAYWVARRRLVRWIDE